ncbi:MAG: glycoside hydrolase family 130 protein [Salinivirgaceae bacterium]|nr:glycoside hydrolase family 130 protein [Salinivirgaceae bacterium]MDY0280256.1 glycoside hydrolase family 130 protein [Salinivirgaceae bacterium]
MKQIVKRKKIRIVGDNSRVITLPHIPSQLPRIGNIILRVLELTPQEAEKLLEETLMLFVDRHKNIQLQLLRHYDKISEYIPQSSIISKTQKLLIGAYLTMEYSIESAALFNPSIVAHPDQTLLPKGSMRFIMSLRATGEGHISSIVFRSGTVDKNFVFNLDTVSEYVETPAMVHDPFYDNSLFQMKLQDLKAWNETSQIIMNKLGGFFTYAELKLSIQEVYSNPDFETHHWTINVINWLADSNYKVKFDDETNIGERVIFPVSSNESKGLEDARFVKFTQDDGEEIYYATYTAFNGHSILSQLIETQDFQTFKIITLNGEGVKDKGMALFPRKVNGKYAMLSRQDGENNYIMFSDNLHFWHEATLIQEPQQPWEFVQIGNCGSPIETDKGWLVLTHGVGNMRQYSIGAILLDLDDPTKIIARLEEPLLSANEEEREGYVPNVIYSCGAMIFKENLILPYAASDIACRIATVNLEGLFEKMKFAPKENL